MKIQSQVKISIKSSFITKMVAKTIRCMPNPAFGFVNVDLSKYMDTPVSFVINSINGQKVIEGNWDRYNPSVTNLDLVVIQDGLYILYVKPKNRQVAIVKFCGNQKIG